MAKDNQVLVRLNDPQFEAFKEFAEDRDYNHAEASREIIKSRLAGEGYLQNQHYDSPVTDGGVEKKVDETQEILSDQLQEQQTVQLYLNTVLILSILWLVGNLAFSVPTLVTVVTGILLLGGLSYGYYQYWGK